MKKIFLVLIAIMFVAVGCGTTGKRNDSEIIIFSYNYGDYSSGYYDFSVNLIDDKVYFSDKGMNGVELNITNYELDKYTLSDIAKIINDNEIYKWNGFDKSDNDIFDGYSFSLRVTYVDGGEIKAHGYMKYPSNYDEAHEKLANYLESLAKEIQISQYNN